MTTMINQENDNHMTFKNMYFLFFLIGYGSILGDDLRYDGVLLGQAACRPDRVLTCCYVKSTSTSAYTF